MYAHDDEVLWFIVTAPYPQAATGRLYTLLLELYSPQQASDFKGITLVKMKRRGP